MMAMREETRRDYKQLVRRIVAGIAGDLDRAATLADLAREACLSPFHFHRVFTSLVGESPAELQRRLRLERAALRLRVSAEPIIEIAFDAGYATHEAFTKAFRGAFGVSPSRFRRDRRAATQLAAVNGVHYDPSGTPPRFVQRIRGGKLMKVEIREVPAMRAACMAHVGPYNQIGQACMRLWGWVQKAGVPPAPLLGIFYDDPNTVAPSELRSDAGILVPEGFKTDDPEVHVVDIPANTYAVATHVGPYRELGDAWARFIGDWFPTSGHTMGSGLCFEIYTNDPTQIPEDQVVTELYQPIAG